MWQGYTHIQVVGDVLHHNPVLALGGRVLGPQVGGVGAGLVIGRLILVQAHSVIWVKSKV